MRVIKNINNNISLCLDSNGRELVAFGKGIGFIKPPNDIPLSKIERTFYNVKDLNIGDIKNIPTQIINIAIKITDMVSKELHADYPSSMVLALSDHIYYAIQRHKQKIIVDIALLEEVKQSYPNEISIANKCIEMINKELGINLPTSEVTTLAMHFIYDRLNDFSVAISIDTSTTINKCIEIVENFLMINIDRNGFNCSRFITHIDYLIKRSVNHSQINSENKPIFDDLRKNYMIVYQCALKISELIESSYSVSLNDEEIMYLMLHINRLCSRQ